MFQAIVTRHARQRIKKRSSIPPRCIQKEADYALNFGLKHGELTGQLKRYADKLYLEEERANNIRVHRGLIWLFAGNTLLTVIDLPGNLARAASKLIRRKNRQEGV